MTVETDLALLKHEVVSVFEIFSRLDLTITKLNDLFTNVNKLLAVHEEKLNNQDRQNTVMDKTVEKLKVDVVDSNKAINDRIAAVQQSITVEQKESEKRITQAVAELKKDLIEIMVADRKEARDNIEVLEKRIDALEKWRWIILGGATVLGFFANKIFAFLQLVAK